MERSSKEALDRSPCRDVASRGHPGRPPGRVQSAEDRQTLAGLGDDAFWAPGGIVFVQKGSRGFTVSTPSLALISSSAPQAILTLAAAALGRL